MTFVGPKEIEGLAVEGPEAITALVKAHISYDEKRWRDILSRLIWVLLVVTITPTVRSLILSIRHFEEKL
ncbi:hypothetical protein Plhal710r2_c002g0005221 [Plasmopara halstedii]